MPSTQYGANWQRGGTGVNTFDVTLPSGAVVLMKRALPADLIMAGVADDLDLLTKFVDKVVVQPGTTGIKADMTTGQLGDIGEMFKDKESLIKFMVLADKVSVQCCVQPKLHLDVQPQCRECKWEGLDPTEHPGDHEFDPTPRDDAYVYTDSIDFVDKVAMMNAAVGGADGWETFLQQQQESLAATSAVEDVQLPTERSAGYSGPSDGVDDGQRGASHGLDSGVSAERGNAEKEFRV